jgi:hypothetical protein
MIMRVFESDYNRKQSWINLKICYKTHVFRATVCVHGIFSYLCIAVEKLLMILTFK